MTKFNTSDFANIIKHQNMAGKVKGWTAIQLAALGNACQDDAALVWLQNAVPAFNSVWAAKIGQGAMNAKIGSISHGFQAGWDANYPSVGKIAAYLGPVDRKTNKYIPK